MHLLLSLHNVTCAGTLISNWIHSIRGTSRLVVDTADIESVATGKERWKEMSAFPFAYTAEALSPLPLTVT